MKKFLLPLLIFVCITEFSFSQPAPARYGKVDIADLQMTVYDLDTTAEAVVLCDYGVFNSNTFEFSRFKRVKILKKTGYDYLDETYYIPGSSALKGCTYNLENGEVVESKLKAESIFKERIYGDNYRFKAAMPDVKVGSVVDIYYSFTGLPSVWYFQDDVPVRWSELRVPSTPYLTFQKSFYGFEPLFLNEDGRWISKNMPALRAESYVNSIYNYMTKFEFEIQSITYPGYYKFYTSSWDAVNTYLLENDNFGVPLKVVLFLTDESAALKKTNLQGLPLMTAACDLIKKKIKYNDEKSLYTSTDLSISYRKGSGNSADINISLIVLLKKLDFDAFPIVLSTRDNGIIPLTFPTIDKFNYVVAGVRYNNKVYCLDATEQNLPAGMLPFRALNGKGRIIAKQGSEWVDLTPTADRKEVVYCNMKMDETGTLTGTITYTESDYEALYSRDSYKTFNSQDEYVKDMESDYPGLTINSFKFEDLDSIHKPLKEIMDVTLTGYADIIGDMISLRPMLIEQMESNPFKAEKRKYPIDFGHATRSRFILNIEIPEGYEVSEMPKPGVIQIPDKSAKFTYKASQTGNTISLVANMEITRALYYESDYALIKEFFNQIISKESEVFMLKKKAI